MTYQPADYNERISALDSRKSFIIQAPAGSGKTEILIQRYLKLLTIVDVPEEILALTFTKKAAFEMRSRILGALQDAFNEHQPETKHKQLTTELAKKVLSRSDLLSWHLLENPNRLRVQTIDALCSTLTSQLPLLAHFGAQPSIATDPENLYQEATETVLKTIDQDTEWKHCVTQLLIHLDNDINKFTALIFSLLQKRDQWLPFLNIEVNNSEIRKHLETTLHIIIEEAIANVCQTLPKEILSKIFLIANYAAQFVPEANLLYPCKNITNIPSRNYKSLTYWQAISNLLLTKDGNFRKVFNKNQGFQAKTYFINKQEHLESIRNKEYLVELIKSIENNEHIRLALAEIFKLPPPHYTDDQWELLNALINVLKLVTAHLRLSFSYHGKIDFIENAQAALLALGDEENPTDLSLALDYKIKHILIDEFQDTSFTQYDLLKKLTMGWQNDDGKTIFVVGDPMQSIYRFRQAEVGLFIKMFNEGIGQIDLIPIRLQTNFRSESEIVEWNNKHFSSIFPLTDSIENGAVSYFSSIPADPQKPVGNKVMIQGVKNDFDGQTNNILQLVCDHIQQHPDDTLGILVRSRNHAVNIVKALKKANIKFNGIDLEPLANQQHVIDLFSLTTALLHPGDKIAWLSILRSPLCGILLIDLHRLVNTRPNDNLLEILTNEDNIKELSADGQLRIAKLMNILNVQLAQRERFPLHQWIEDTWVLLGGPACIVDDNQLNDIQIFFKLIRNLSEQGINIAVDLLKKKLNKLYASASHVDCNINIMTIHSAKGLEFDTVIIPHLEAKVPVDEKALLAWTERPLSNGKIGLLLAPIHTYESPEKDNVLYDYIRRQERKKTDHETERLFYVATTRAKKKLCLFFNCCEKDGEIKVEPGSFLHRIWPLWQNLNTIITTSNTSQSALETKQAKLRRLHIDWKNPISVSQMVTSNNPLPAFSLSDDYNTIVGSTTHLILNKLSKTAISWWNNYSEIEQLNYINNLLQRLGLKQHQLRKASAFIKKCIDNTLDDSIGKWILSARNDAHSEFAITTKNKEQYENFIVDRTFIENNVRWIIDYKTTALCNEEIDLNTFLAKESLRHKEQMIKYKKALQPIECLPIKLGLYFPAVPAWNIYEDI